jgi:hypothetical protein
MVTKGLDRPLRRRIDDPDAKAKAPGKELVP